MVSQDSALKKDLNYYPQVFLKEYKYIENKKVLLEVLLITYRYFLVTLMKNNISLLSSQEAFYILRFFSKHLKRFLLWLKEKLSTQDKSVLTG